MDRWHDGQGGRHQRLLGSAHLAGARPAAASGAAVQAVHRPAIRVKPRDIVGLYADPPAHAIVLSVDEKSQIQALDRTQPGLPARRQSHRPLYAASSASTVFIRFLNAIEAEVPVGKVIHVILDNYGPHEHPKTRAWLDRHPRFVFHYTPTSCSWVNAVEGFFAKLSKRRLKRGVFRSIVDLQVAINRFVRETNDDPTPFTWTADPDKIITAVRRRHQC